MDTFETNARSRSAVHPKLLPLWRTSQVTIRRGLLLSLVFGLSSCEIKPDPTEEFDYRCKTNGIIYQDADYLAAVMDRFVKGARESIKDENEGRQNPNYIYYEGEQYFPHENIEWYASPEAFRKYFPDCCRVSRTPDAYEYTNNAYILMMRRDGKLASFVDIYYTLSATTSTGKLQYFRRSASYEVGNCLEIYAERWANADWLIWPMNSWLVWSWWRPRDNRLIVKEGDKDGSAHN